MGDDPKEKMKITILGARGSIPTEGRDMLEFGGATTCVLIEAADQAVYLDAGTGIISSPDIGDKSISILITHPHLDHILGLPFFPYIKEQGRRIDIYGEKRNGISTTMQLERLISPPLWPVRLSDYASDTVCSDITYPLMLGGIRVTGMPADHPGGATVYRLGYAGRSVVFATDFEHNAESMPRLMAFARDADLILYDAQYTEEEYERNKTFGHSTVSQGLKLLRESRAGMMRFVHHDPGHTDDMLRSMEAEVRTERVSFAREGEVICL